MAEPNKATREEALRYVSVMEFFEKGRIQDPVKYLREQIAEHTRLLAWQRQLDPNDSGFAAARKNLALEEYFAGFENIIELERAYLAALVDYEGAQ